jgi:hypothetical protein
VNAAEIISTPLYPTSRLFLSRRSRLSIYAADGEWNQTRFESDILVPLFRDAKHLKIVDRYLGRTYFENGLYAIKDGYRRTLDWVISTFAQATDPSRPHDIQIHAGLGPKRRAAADVANAAAAFRSYAQQLSTTTSLPVSIHLYQERPGQLLHARYIITDQAGIMIDRGMDMLWSDAQMRAAHLATTAPRPLRDFALAYCPTTMHLTKTVRLLPRIL